MPSTLQATLLVVILFHINLIGGVPSVLCGVQTTDGRTGVRIQLDGSLHRTACSTASKASPFAVNEQLQYGHCLHGTIALGRKYFSGRFHGINDALGDDRADLAFLTSAAADDRTTRTGQRTFALSRDTSKRQKTEVCGLKTVSGSSRNRRAINVH